jgi:FKBP-type peptidyl-prolyl cis-trans isomerase FkpA
MAATSAPTAKPKKLGLVFWLGILLLTAAAGAAAWATTSPLHFETTASGLQYQVVKEGEGPKAGASDYALVTYTGRLQDGTVFDSNAGRSPTPMPVSGVVPGFSEALQLMNKGATYRVRIPPELAYGAAGTPGGPIPPNATLEFDITLVDFQTLTPEQLQQLQMMQMMQQQGGGGEAPGGAAPQQGAPQGGGGR